MSILNEILNDYQSSAIKGIAEQVKVLKQPIDFENLKDNKLITACKGKKDAHETIEFLTNSAKLKNVDKKNVIEALTMCMKQMLEVISFEPINVPDDIVSSISQARKQASINFHAMKDIIDNLEDNEEAKNDKISNTKPESLIERFAP